MSFGTPVRSVVRRACLASGRLLGKTMCRVLTERRQTAMANVVRVFPNWTAEQRRDLVHSSFLHTGMGIAETLWAWCVPDTTIDRYEIDGIDVMDQAVARGHGVLLLQPHTSCLDTVARPICQRWPSSVITGYTADTMLARWVRKRREKLLAKVYSNDSMRSVVRALKQGEVIWTSPDIRVPIARGGIPTRYFDQSAMTTDAPARLAAMTDAAVISLFPVRSPCGSHYRLQFKQISSLAADPQRATQQINDHFEALVRAHPEQYMWSTRRFEPRRRRT